MWEIVYINEKSILYFNFLLIFVSFVFIFTVSIKEVLSSKSVSKSIGSYISFLIFLLIAFRTRGWDVEQYYNIYTSLQPNWDFSRSWQEPGFLALNYSFKYMNAPYFVYNLFVASFLSFFIFHAVRCNSYYVGVPFLFIFLFYFFRGPYGQIRQAFSIFLFFYSLQYLSANKKSIWIYYLLNVMCMLIHYISFMALFIPLIAKVTLTRKRLFIYTLILPFFVFFSHSLPFILSLDFFKYIPGADKFIYYIHRGDGKGGLLNAETLVFFFVICVIFLFLKKDRVDSLHIKIFLLGVAVYLLLSFDLLVASRMSSIYTLSFIFIISNILYDLKINNRILIFSLSFLIGAYCLLNEFIMLSNGMIIYG